MKRKGKEGTQVGMFDYEMHEPVDIQKKPPGDIEVVIKKMEVVGKEVEIVEAEKVARPLVALGVTACPACGGLIRMMPDGVRRCEKCRWYQLFSEGVSE